jgi:hypothetical protein
MISSLTMMPIATARSDRSPDRLGVERAAAISLLPSAERRKPSSSAEILVQDTPQIA